MNKYIDAISLTKGSVLTHFSWFLIFVFLVPTNVHSQANPEEAIVYQYDTMNNGTWNYFSKIEMTYNAGNSIKEEIVYNYDTIINDWIMASRLLHTYTSFDSISVTIGFKWKNSSWDTASRIQYTYDSIHRKKEVLNSTYQAGSWSQGIKNLYTYNGSADRSEYALIWSNGSFDTIQRIDYFYNGIDNVDSTKSYFYQSGGWTPDLLSKYHYNQYDQKDTVKTYFYLNSKWKLINIFSYTYNGSKLMQFKSLNWLDSQSKWIKSQKDKYF